MNDDQEGGGMSLFYKGMDISGLQQYLDNGMQVRDVDGTAVEPFALMKKYGVNSARLRIWVNPERVPESGGYCSLERTLEMAERIRENGMSFLLDFHYSDFWADPAKQKKPSAWEGLDRAQLEEQVYEYTRDTLLAFQAQGTLPDMVQIGNEIRSGLLFPEGELPDYEGMTGLVNAGIRGARSAAGSGRMKVMIHLDQGGRYKWLHQWFEGARSCGLEDFDLIGLSYYPFWHGNFLELKASMEQLAEDYHKPILLVETAYAWRKSRKGFIDEEQIRIGGLPATPFGQKQNLDILMYLLSSLPENLGRGIYYWEPLCVPGPEGGGWAENMGLLDEEGRVMEGIAAFAMSAAERAAEPECWGRLKERLSREEDGVCAGDSRGQNLLENGDFSEFSQGWIAEKSSEDVVMRFTEGEPGSVSRIFTVESPRNFRFRMETGEELPEAGSYELTVEARGADTTGVDIRLFAKIPCGGACRETTLETAVHPVERWRVCRLLLKDVAEGPVKVGIDISSPPICFSVRNFRLRRVEGAQQENGE